VGGLLATLTFKRAAMCYGLVALGGLIAAFALGYALNAGYTALMFRYGPVVAGLTAAGGLLAAAASCVVAARIVSRRARMDSAPLELSSQYAHVHLARAARPRVIALGAGLAGAATLAVAIVVLRTGRASRVYHRVGSRKAD
jgi:hypothetical protein